MNILVYKQEPEDENKVKCPKCGEIIKIEKFDNIIKFNSNQSEMLNEIKNEIEIINKSNEISKIKNKIKIINLIINDLIEEIEKNKKNIQNVLSNNYNEIKNVENDINKKTNIIKGIFTVEDIYQDVAIFNQYVEDEGFDVYLNNEKINVIKSYKVQYKDFKQNGKGDYEFKIIFKDKKPNLERIFQNCQNLISIDLSNFDTTNINSMSWMFNECHKLK